MYNVVVKKVHVRYLISWWVSCSSDDEWPLQLFILTLLLIFQVFTTKCTKNIIVIIIIIVIIVVMINIIILVQMFIRWTMSAVSDELFYYVCCVCSHFHLDHCGALPYMSEMVGYEGKIFMTHPTKAICPIMLVSQSLTAISYSFWCTDLSAKTRVMSHKYKYNKTLIRRWDSERELFYDDIMHILQSTVDSPINMKLWHRHMLHRVYCKPEAKKNHHNAKAKLTR